MERRAYSSERRAEQARETRRAIVNAARDLFVESGYSATTMDAIAERARVSRRTVFTSVGGKGALLKTAWDWAIAGDDEPVPMAQRPHVARMLAETDPATVVGQWVEMVTEVIPRIQPLTAAIHVAVESEPEIAAQLEKANRESLVGATALVRHLHSLGGLRSDFTLAEAADVCWAFMDPHLMRLLVQERGWTTERYAEWLRDTLTRQLVGSD